MTVDQAARKLAAASGAAYRLGRIRDELVFAGFKTSSSPLLRKVRLALRSAEGAVRNAHGKLRRAEIERKIAQADISACLRETITEDSRRTE